ncbi:MAG: peptide-methionine (S)-S-oxide reductase MsrA [Treponema sp.]|jgi:methionine-S-sulfoxide reductase|nr:peptide-methionine (S)-S-oxide reductase MsrA [Treponema sp.]
MKEIYLAGGCFWGTEKYLSLIPGVIETEAGYANGNTENPSYEDLCRRNTGHAETVRVRYDPSALSLEKLLSLYYEVIDPVSVNRQGADQGTQYRTGIYYTDGADRPVIEKSLAELQKKYDKPVAVESEALHQYFRAEEYHQKYLDRNPGGYCHIKAESFERAKRA